MNKLQINCLILFSLALFTPSAAPSVIDFENEPSLPPQPNSYVDAGPMQVLSGPGYTIRGGVVLGDPTFLPAFPVQGTRPNLYGTSDLGHPSLLPVITLDLSVPAISVSGVLFNGQTLEEDYVVAAFSGATLIDSAIFFAMLSNIDSGFGRFSLTRSTTMQITSVVFSTPNAALNGWDFYVDSIAVQPVPEPATWSLLLVASMFFAVRSLARR